MSVIKWAGSKKRLLKDIRPYLPDNYSCYVEPFFGSGALFFSVRPYNSILNDANQELMSMYKVLKDKGMSLLEELEKLQDEYNKLSKEDKEKYYYEKRELYNNKCYKEVEGAALFIFLNKTGFNGLYRVNKQGKFNVPWSKRDKLNLIDKSIYDCSEALERAVLYNKDFEEVCQNLPEGSFIYFDPPYHNTFTGYQQNGFTEDDQIRLFNLFKKLSDEGHLCLLSNNDTDFIKDLYKDYDINYLYAKKLIGYKKSNEKFSEVLIKNY